jgi:hypothetical protein
MRDEIAGEPDDRRDVAVAETVGGRRRRRCVSASVSGNSTPLAPATSSAIATSFSASRSAKAGLT